MSQMLFGSAAMKAEARSSGETVMNAHLTRDLLERSTILQARAVDTRSWDNASPRWHVLTQGVLTPKFWTDLRESQNISPETSDGAHTAAKRP